MKFFGQMLWVLALALAWPMSAGAAQFDLSLFHNEREALADTVKWWAAEIDKQTAGRVQFKAQYSGALSSAAETLNAVRNGSIPAGLAPASFVSGLIPPAAYLEPLFWLTSDLPAAERRSMRCSRGSRSCFARAGIESLWLQPSYGLLVACRDKHLKKPADWKGVKVRAAGRWQGIQLTRSARCRWRSTRASNTSRCRTRPWTARCRSPTWRCPSSCTRWRRRSPTSRRVTPRCMSSTRAPGTR